MIDLSAQILKWVAQAQLAAISVAGASVVWLKIISAMVSAVFAILIVAAVAKIRAAGEIAAAAVPVTGPMPASSPTGPLRVRWESILAHLDSPQEAEWKVAVMEADKLVETALAQAGFMGESFGDRLMAIAPGTLASLDGLWWAHKVRNRLAHELDYFLRYTEARQAIGYYEQTLTELQVI